MARLAAELSYDPRRQSYASELASVAMEQVLECRDRRAELHVRLYRDPLLRHPRCLMERLANAEEIARLAVEVGDYSACFLAALGKSSALSMLGDAAAAGHAAEFAIGIVATSGVRLHHELLTVYRVYRGVMDGRFENAANDFARCRTLVEEQNLPYLFDVCWPTMLIPYREEDRLLELMPLADDTVRRRPNALVYSALLSWLKTEVGCFSDATFLIERLSADRFANLSNGAEGVAGMAFLAEVCAALKRVDCAEVLLDRLLPYAGFNVTLNAFSAFGSVERYIGLLAKTVGRKSEAIEHFQKSLLFDRRSGARPWALYSGIQLAASLAERATPEDQARASELLDTLYAEATELKMGRALLKLVEIRSLLATPSGHSKKLREIASSINGPESPRIKKAFQSCNRATSSKFETIDQSVCDPIGSNRQGAEPIALFRRNAEYWEIGRQGRAVNLSHRKGLALIALLLHHPGREFAALELAYDCMVDRSAPVGEREEIADIAAPILDGEAKQAYRERLREIRAEIDGLREANNLAGVDKLLEEQDFLTGELGRAIGLFGRDRKFGSESERARKRISIAIARAISVISVHDPDLANHLKRSIKTGNLCCYSPELEYSIKWILDGP